VNRIIIFLLALACLALLLVVSMPALADTVTTCWDLGGGVIKCVTTKQ
jgi:hypothetical protein